MMIDLKSELEELIRNIGTKNMYSGNKIPDSVMHQFEIEEKEHSIGILVPFWLSVLEHGRGPRKSNKDYGLVKIIYRWMQKHNMFRSDTEKGRLNEVRFITWYINKYGNQHFRSKVFIDIYTQERKKTIEKINQKYTEAITKITIEVI